MYRKAIKYLVIGSLILSLTGCGFSIGNTIDLGSGSVSKTSYVTKDHQTVGDASVENKKKGSASFNISEDGNVEMTTFKFKLPNGYKAEAPAGIVDKTTNHIISYVMVRDSANKGVAEVFDGKLSENWSSDTDEALKEIASILKDSQIKLDLDSINSKDLINENLYSLYVADVGNGSSLIFYANRNNGDYAFILCDVNKNSNIGELIVEAMSTSYLDSLTGDKEDEGGLTSRFGEENDDNGNIGAETEAETLTPAQPMETQAPTITPNPVETQAPTITPNPVETQAPTITPNPVETQAPTITPNPVETQAPVQTPNKSMTNNTLSAKTQSILSSIDTDYNKINWGVVYSPFEDEGVVISIAPYSEGGTPGLVIGITNLYNKDVTFSGKGYAKNSSGGKVGDVYMFNSAIGSGSTIIQTVPCFDGVPTGEIHWDEIELPNCYEEYVPWEGDWSIKTDSYDNFVVDYKINSNKTMMPGYVTFMLLDSNGNILDVVDDYNSDKGTNTQGSVNTYSDIQDYGKAPADVAMFVNPVAE